MVSFPKPDQEVKFYKRMSWGVDPDSHKTGIALLAEDQDNQVRPIFMGSVDVPRKVKGAACVVANGMLAGRDLHPLFQITDRLAYQGDFIPVVLESQEIIFGHTRKPSSIVQLAQITGALAVTFTASSRKNSVYFRTPKEWKNSRPKHIDQGRSYKRLGIPFEVVGKNNSRYCVPTAPAPQWSDEMKKKFNDIKKTEWKHIGDAIGLAWYGINQIPNKVQE